MSAVETDIGFLTVRDIAAEIGVTEGRVRQLISELKEAGTVVGQLVGTIRLLTHQDALKIMRFHDQKRRYEKSDEDA